MLLCLFLFFVYLFGRLEKVDLKCTYSKVKIMGTLVCLAGAVSMNFLHDSPVSQAMPTQESVVLYNNISNQVMGTKRIIGSMYLLAAIFAVSCTMVLQVAQSQIYIGFWPFPSFVWLVLVASREMIVWRSKFHRIYMGK